MKELKILSPTAILGYGFPVDSFQKGIAELPDVVAVDAGSTDPGPYYLGEGISFTDRNAVKRDLSLMLKECIPRKIPLIIGTAGGSGAKPNLEAHLEIILEIAKEQSLAFKLATIPSDIPQQIVLDKYKHNKIIDVTCTPPLTEKDILESQNIVAQMGMEPIIKALDQSADVILTGRCYDPAVFAALPVKLCYDKGLAIHLGKILECASIAATPGSGSDCMMGYLGKDYFKVKPLNSNRRCTTVSVSAHTLYEKSDPFLLPGPGGVLNLTHSTFTQVDDQTVMVKGSVYEETPYALKLEAAKYVGARTVSIAGSADPILIKQLDEIIAGVKERTKDNFAGSLDNYYLDFKIYGVNGVSLFEQEKKIPSEIGIIIEAVAKTQEEANTLCSFARSTMLHFGYTGRIATAGNLAFPFSPSDFEAGNVYEFSLYHLMADVDPLEFFPVTMIEVR